MNLADHADELPRYRDWAPTQFDARGLGCDDQQDWIVHPCMRTRDSECMDESNFHAAQRLLDDAGAQYEVHRFGHWGPGWFEIILVHPDHAEHVAEVVCRLADYPLLDEDDHSQRECEAESAAWECYGHRQYAEAIGKEYELQPETIDWLATHDCAWELYRDSRSENEDFGHPPDLTRDELAAFIRKARKGESCRDA